MAHVKENWNAAFEAVKSQFEVPDLHPEQRKAIRSFFQGKNVFANIPTGFGKSLIFQCLLIVTDIVHKKPRGSSIIVVVFFLFVFFLFFFVLYNILNTK